MSKHTPGPWRVLPEECDRQYIRVRGMRLGCRYKVANVLTPIYPGVDGREAEETRANARLIAAAPRMLDELEKVAKLLEAIAETDYPVSDEIDSVKATIDQAIRGAA